ncbi:hypothetical protein TNCV_3849661 [Trichonephila clavipes]|nr:hypothetical protein TNCV_3849661 [Trichonephila clavipes]
MCATILFSGVLVAVVLNENPNELLSAISNVNASSDDDDGPYEIFFVPDDADKLQAIFEAVKTCLSLYASVDFENDGRTFSFPIISNQFDKKDSVGEVLDDEEEQFEDAIEFTDDEEFEDAES